MEENILRQARVSKDLTQMELAKKLGFKTPQMVSNWERGLCHVPMALIGRFCKITGADSAAIKKSMVDSYFARLNKKVKSPKTKSEAKSEK